MRPSTSRKSSDVPAIDTFAETSISALLIDAAELPARVMCQPITSDTSDTAAFASTSP